MNANPGNSSNWQYKSLPATLMYRANQCRLQLRHRVGCCSKIYLCGRFIQYALCCEATSLSTYFDFKIFCFVLFLCVVSIILDTSENGMT